MRRARLHIFNCLSKNCSSLTLFCFNFLFYILNFAFANCQPKFLFCLFCNSQIRSYAANRLSRVLPVAAAATNSLHSFFNTRAFRIIVYSFVRLDASIERRRSANCCQTTVATARQTAQSKCARARVQLLFPPPSFFLQFADLSPPSFCAHARLNATTRQFHYSFLFAYKNVIFMVTQTCAHEIKLTNGDGGEPLGDGRTVWQRRRRAAAVAATAAGGGRRRRRAVKVCTGTRRM